MQRKWFILPIGILSVTILTGYTLFTMSARRPLLLSKSLIFSSALLRAVPSSILDQENWSAAFGLARHALAAPVSTDIVVVGGRRYDVPLPTHSFRDSKRDSNASGNRNGFAKRNSSALHTYITFATPEQLDAYYMNTLPEAGWEFSDRMGGARMYRKNTARLVIGDSYYRGTRINQLAVVIDDIDSTKH